MTTTQQASTPHEQAMDRGTGLRGAGNFVAARAAFAEAEQLAATSKERRRARRRAASMGLDRGTLFIGLTVACLILGAWIYALW